LDSDELKPGCDMQGAGEGNRGEEENMLGSDMDFIEGKK